MLLCYYRPFHKQECKYLTKLNELECQSVVFVQSTDCVAKSPAHMGNYYKSARPVHLKGSTGLHRNPRESYFYRRIFVSEPHVHSRRYWFRVYLYSSPIPRLVYFTESSQSLFSRLYSVFSFYSLHFPVFPEFPGAERHFHPRCRSRSFRKSVLRLPASSNQRLFRGKSHSGW